MDPISPELIKAGKDLLVANSDIKISVGNQYYNFLGPKDEVKYLNGPFACYGTSTLYIKPHHLIMVDKSISDGCLKRNKNYSHYCLNEGIFSHVFITKDIEEIIELGGTILDIRYSGQEVISGAISLRYLSEYRDRIKVWNFLVENKVDKNIAFILMHFYSFLNNEKALILNIMASGHSILNYHPYNKKYIELFYNMYHRKLIEKPAFNISRSYIPTDGIFIQEYRRDFSKIESPIFFSGKEVEYTDSLGRKKIKNAAITKDALPDLEQWFLNFIAEGEMI